MNNFRCSHTIRTAQWYSGSLALMTNFLMWNPADFGGKQEILIHSRLEFPGQILIHPNVLKCEVKDRDIPEHVQVECELSACPARDLSTMMANFKVNFLVLPKNFLSILSKIRTDMDDRFLIFIHFKTNYPFLFENNYFPNLLGEYRLRRNSMFTNAAKFEIASQIVGFEWRTSPKAQWHTTFDNPATASPHRNVRKLVNTLSGAQQKLKVVRLMKFETS